MKHRRAFTLVELLAAITVGSVIMGLALMLLQLVLRTDRGSRRQLVETRATAELADVFRRDVRAARSADVTGVNQSPASRLVLQSGEGQTVEYIAGVGEIARTRKSDEKVVARESFRFSSLAGARFDIAMHASRPLATLEMTRTKTGGPPAARVNHPPFRIEAAVAADHRYAGTATGEANDE